MLYNITHSALNALLIILIKFGFEWLPKDSRTILETPKKIAITSIGTSKYWYNGIKTNLLRIYSNLQNAISIALTFNVDGIPIYNNSKKAFWPILALQNQTKYQRPIVISIFYGEEKPNLEPFLRPFVEDLRDLMENGLIVNGFQITVTFRCFVCDTPARAHLKGISIFKFTVTNNFISIV